MLHRIRGGKRPFLSVLLLASLSVGLLAACSDDEDDPEPTTVATTVATATATATDEATAEPTEDATAAAGDATVMVVEEGELAPFLAAANGMTLYTFANDTEGVSNCAEGCIDNWPALIVEDGEEPVAGEGVDGDLTVIEREDGTMQVAYNGMPLYFFVGDTAAGDTTGHEVGGVWFIATP